MVDAAQPARRADGSMPTWIVATVSGLFGLLYAYFVWNAVGFLVSQVSGPFGLNGYGWFVLILPIVFPLVVFAGAFAIGRRRRTGTLALMMLAGLCLVAVFWMNVIGYAVLYGADLLGA